MRRLIWAALLVASMLLALGAPAHGATLSFLTSQSRFGTSDNQGWWSGTTYLNQSTNDNYFVGQSFDSGELRNFFTFDVSPLASTAVSARLELRRYGVHSDEPTQIYGLFDVDTDAVTLNDNESANAAIWADLGEGTSYGTFEIPAAGDDDAIVSLPLNAAGVADINAARGGFFSIGGRLLTLSFDVLEDSIFSASIGTGFGNPGWSGRLVIEAFPLPERLADCKDGGWHARTDSQGTPFRNQGLCIAFVVNHRP